MAYKRSIDGLVFVVRVGLGRGFRGLGFEFLVELSFQVWGLGFRV